MDDDKVETVFPLPWWFAVAVAILTSLPGCASDRYLSSEMDAKMREVCEPAGCEIITTPHWQVIEQILSGLGLTAQ